MAWKGTRPQDVVDRDDLVLTYLKSHGMRSRNEVADALGLSRSLTYLSLDRLRSLGKTKRCLDAKGNQLWTAKVDVPCP